MKTEDEARRRAIEAGYNCVVYNPDTWEWGVTNIKKVDRGLGTRNGQDMKDSMFYFLVDEFSAKDMRDNVEEYFNRNRPL
jgi:hypothetical protein